MKTIYKKTSTGATQVWMQEIHPDGDKYRTISGQIDGKKVTAEWTQCKGKNIGKANETTPQQQCELEVAAHYVKKLAQGKYFEAQDDAEGGKTTFFAPMLAKKWKDYKPTKGYSQPKLDGVRCIMKKDGMWSRNGKPLLSSPHIHDAFKGYFEEHPDAIFDGELYCDRLSDDFEKIISLARQQKPTAEDLAESAKYLKLYMYDFPSVQGTFSVRMSNLKTEFDNEFNDYQIRATELVQTYYVITQSGFDVLYSEYMEQGYEGQMIRSDDEEYVNTRSKQLLKRKEFITEEFQIEDIIEGEGNWAGMAKSVTIKLPDGRTQQSGMRGTRKFCKKLLKEKEEYKGGDVTVRYQRLTGDGKLLFPVAVAFFKGKRDL